MENKWLNGAIPALLIHCCIGSVYCWSLLKDEVAAMIGCGVSSIEMAFSLAIFFLGMSAAFGGRFVEKNVKHSALLSMFFFCFGLCGSIWSLYLKSSIMFLLSYGVCMGIGLGLGYLAPVKTLMLWFNKHKGLATGIAISGFGLSKAIFSPFIVWCNTNYNIVVTLLTICGISFICMLLASILIHKPSWWVEEKKDFNWDEVKGIILNPTYIKIWLLFYINITCGLALISFEKSITLASGMVSIGLIASLSAIFNTAGRFISSSLSDFLCRKEIIYLLIFSFSAMALAVNVGTLTPILIAILLMVVNFGYGGGFSTLPILLQSRFGMKQISMIHGFALSAWAWAGLSGNQISNIILNKLELGWSWLFGTLLLLYLVGYGLSRSLLNEKLNTKCDE